MKTANSYVFFNDLMRDVLGAMAGGVSSTKYALSHRSVDGDETEIEFEVTVTRVADRDVPRVTEAKARRWFARKAAK